MAPVLHAVSGRALTRTARVTVATGCPHNSSTVNAAAVPLKREWLTREDAPPPIHPQLFAGVCQERGWMVRRLLLGGKHGRLRCFHACTVGSSIHVPLRTAGSRFGAGGCKLMSAALTACPNLVELEMSRASVPVAVCLAVVSQPALTCVRCAAVRLV